MKTVFDVYSGRLTCVPFSAVLGDEWQYSHSGDGFSVYYSLAGEWVAVLDVDMSL